MNTTFLFLSHRPILTIIAHCLQLPNCESLKTRQVIIIVFLHRQYLHYRVVILGIICDLQWLFLENRAISEILCRVYFVPLFRCK